MCAYPIVQGGSSQSGIMIPEIWALGYNAEFYLRTVFGEIANTRYQGQITKQGDAVNIISLPDVSAAIHDHTDEEDLEVDIVKPSKQTLLIDKGKYFNISLSDVQAAQSAYKDYPEALKRHFAQAMKAKIDKEILEAIVASGHSKNIGNTTGKKSGLLTLGVTGTPVNVAAADAIVKLIHLAGCALDEQDIPDEGRWMVLPALAISYIKQSDLASVSVSGDSVSMLRNGKWGIVDRFTIYMSNNVYTAGGEWFPLFGHKSALTFAAQVTVAENLRNQKQFGDLSRYLHVFGYKVVKDTALGTLCIDYS